MKQLNDRGINSIEIVIDSRKKPIGVKVFSVYSSWDSLFIALEGIALLAKLSIKEGIPPDKVAEKIQLQFNQAFMDYHKVKSKKKKPN